MMSVEIPRGRGQSGDRSNFGDRWRHDQGVRRTIELALRFIQSFRQPEIDDHYKSANSSRGPDVHTNNYEDPARAEYAASSGPWSRYWARAFDITLFGVIGWIALAIIYPASLQSSALTNTALDAMLTVIIGMTIEGFVYGLFSWSPGKAIFGISVRHCDGTKLTLPQVLVRNFWIWVIGLGLSLPIISFFTLYSSYRDSEEGNRSAWDRKRAYDVHQKDISILRRSAAIIFTIAFIAGINVLGLVMD